jgi:hypothetical protein
VQIIFKKKELQSRTLKFTLNAQAGPAGCFFAEMQKRQDYLKELNKKRGISYRKEI